MALYIIFSIYDAVIEFVVCIFLFILTDVIISTFASLAILIPFIFVDIVVVIVVYVIVIVDVVDVTMNLQLIYTAAGIAVFVVELIAPVVVVINEVAIIGVTVVIS